MTLGDAVGLILDSIKDEALETRVRLGEGLVLRLRTSKEQGPKKWTVTSPQDQELTIDLCEPVTELDRDELGAVGLRRDVGDAHPLKVLWSFGSGSISDYNLKLLRAAAQQLGWTVDDHLLRRPPHGCSR